MTHAPADGRVGVVVMAYGSPRTRDDVLPYYTDIRRGRPPTDQQLADLLARYEAIAPGGGDALSPLAARTEAQARALQAELDRITPDRYAVALGLKHATPSIEDTVDEMAARGIGSIVGLVLAPHYSALSVGQYLDRLRSAAAPHGIAVAAIDSWATEPSFVQFLARELRSCLDTMPADTKVLFTAHSLPARVLEMDDPYVDEIHATAAAVAGELGLAAWSQWAVAWQSAGRTPEPWLGPDVLLVIDELASSEHHASPGGDDRLGLVVCACGFVADHLEVLYDLDVEAAGRARALGLEFARTGCVNDDPGVMAELARLVAARAETAESTESR
jgi:ferrochelatase